MTIWTRVAIMCLMLVATFAVWIGGIMLQWWLKLRDLPQTIAMLIVMALPAFIAPSFARGTVALVRPDAALLSPRTSLWFGVALLLIWAALGALLTLGMDEGLVAKIALAGLFLGAFMSTYAGTAPDAVSPTGDSTGVGSP